MNVRPYMRVLGIGALVLIVSMGMAEGKQPEKDTVVTGHHVDFRKSLEEAREKEHAKQGVVVQAEAAIVMDADTKQVLFEKNPDKWMHPASTTKVVTLLTALEEHGTRFDELAKISKYAVSMEPSILGLRVGDELPLHSVAEGMMVTSGNDAAVVVAETVSGNVKDFATRMNAMAKKAGAKHSQFKNPHGLTEQGHYTTARDLALISSYGMQIPMFRDMVYRDFYKVPYENRSGEWVRTTNHLIRQKVPGVNGLKTGYTSAAGECLIATATRGGKTVVVVVLNDDERWIDAKALLDYGFKRLGVK